MAFERDLGYLDKFFDNLEAHATTLGGDAGARLRQLIGEERARWVEIRGLINAPAAADKGAKAAAPKPTEAPATTQTGDVTAAATRVPSAGFTVGSLRGR